eukprot:4502892-Alexandrium_andersonii.AAC.1
MGPTAPAYGRQCSSQGAGSGGGYAGGPSPGRVEKKSRPLGKADQTAVSIAQMRLSSARKPSASAIAARCASRIEQAFSCTTCTLRSGP